MQRKKVVVVGGGITGLSATYYLKKQMDCTGLPYDITLLEASARLGGKINTIHKQGFTIEQGPDSFLARKKPGMDLLKELGLTDRLIRNHTGQAYVSVDDRLHPIPQGTYMGIPVQEQPLLDSEIVTEAGKRRALDEVNVAKGAVAPDQSLGTFFRSRFGEELVDNLLEPLLSGIYSGDIDQMSLMATFPQFYHLEQKYGSLLRGLREELPQSQANTGKKAGQFMTLKQGLTTLVDALATAIGEDSFQLGTKVIDIKKGSPYQITLQDGSVVEADAVIMATPHHVVPAVFTDNPFLSKLNEVPLASVANVVLAFDASTIKKELDGTGFVVSRKSPYTITACTWTQRKWPHTTPDGKVLLRAFVGKPSDQKVVALSDDEMVHVVRKDLAQIMGIMATPEFTMVNRFLHAMPQYTVGHHELIKQMQRKMATSLPGVFLAGASYHGVGIPDCIGQGKEAAESVIDFLQNR